MAENETLEPTIALDSEGDAHLVTSQPIQDFQCPVTAHTLAKKPNERIVYLDSTLSPTLELKPGETQEPNPNPLNLYLYEIAKDRSSIHTSNMPPSCCVVNITIYDKTRTQKDGTKVIAPACMHLTVNGELEQISFEEKVYNTLDKLDTLLSSIISKRIQDYHKQSTPCKLIIISVSRQVESGNNANGLLSIDIDLSDIHSLQVLKLDGKGYWGEKINISSVTFSKEAKLKAFQIVSTYGKTIFKNTQCWRSLKKVIIQDAGDDSDTLKKILNNPNLKQARLIVLKISDHHINHLIFPPELPDTIQFISLTNSKELRTISVGEHLAASQENHDAILTLFAHVFSLSIRNTDIDIGTLNILVQIPSLQLLYMPQHRQGARIGGGTHKEKGSMKNKHAGDILRLAQAKQLVRFIINETSFFLVNIFLPFMLSEDDTREQSRMPTLQTLNLKGALTTTILNINIATPKLKQKIRELLIQYISEFAPHLRDLNMSDNSIQSWTGAQFPKLEILCLDNACCYPFNQAAPFLALKTLDLTNCSGFYNKDNTRSQEHLLWERKMLRSITNKRFPSINCLTIGSWHISLADIAFNVEDLQALPSLQHLIIRWSTPRMLIGLTNLAKRFPALDTLEFTSITLPSSLIHTLLSTTPSLKRIICKEEVIGDDNLNTTTQDDLEQQERTYNLGLAIEIIKNEIFNTCSAPRRTLINHLMPIIQRVRRHIDESKHRLSDQQLESITQEVNECFTIFNEQYNETLDTMKEELNTYRVTKQDTYEVSLNKFETTLIFYFSSGILTTMGKIPVPIKTSVMKTSDVLDQVRLEGVKTVNPTVEYVRHYLYHMLNKYSLDIPYDFRPDPASPKKFFSEPPPIFTWSDCKNVLTRNTLLQAKPGSKTLIPEEEKVENTPEKVTFDKGTYSLFYGGDSILHPPPLQASSKKKEKTELPPSQEAVNTTDNVITPSPTHEESDDKETTSSPTHEEPDGEATTPSATDEIFIASLENEIEQTKAKLKKLEENFETLCNKLRRQRNAERMLESPHVKRKRSEITKTKEKIHELEATLAARKKEAPDNNNSDSAQSKPISPTTASPATFFGHSEASHAARSSSPSKSFKPGQ